MNTEATNARRRSALSHVVERLGNGAGAFHPSGTADDPGQLPDRAAETSSNTQHASALATGVVLDCGISRREGYTHVLWIAPGAEAMLGSARYERLGETIASVPGASAFDWEGSDRLHVRAPGRDWDVLLADARDAVDALVGSA